MQGQAIHGPPAGQSFQGLPIEIAFLLRHGVPVGVLRQAAATAGVVGVTADQAALKTGLIDERTFYRALAHELGLPFLNEPTVDERTRFPESIMAGIVPLAAIHTPIQFAMAPEGPGLASLLARPRRFGPGLAITTPAALLRAVLRARPRAIAWHAANELPESKADWSYRDTGSLRQMGWAAALSGTVSACAASAPGPTLSVIMALSGLMFLGMVGLRIVTTWTRIPVTPPRCGSLYDDRDLPLYTVIIALHRERRVLVRLVEALSALDYPAPKLDIKLVVEADDEDTREALAELRLPGAFQVIVAPPGAPRTKPRALNVALPLARGEFVVVYDAEDVPHPDQLRLAVETFAHVPLYVGCLQARLVIDNTNDSWLTRLFTIEYATLFDVINPGLAALDMPVPLGGTSNHFRRSVLQRLYGWDAWSVTEDADLGIRLALAGYKVADLPSSTLEEAPARLSPWMRQRTRWMKGFMQVCVTHSRKPLDALRSLGPRRFFGAVATTFGTVFAALGYPAFMILSVKELVVDRDSSRDGTSFEVLSSAFGLFLFALGVLAILMPASAALGRRRWWRLLPFVPLLPFYYLLVSVAAWRGLAELFFDPFCWHKTEHGLARTSRSGTLINIEGVPEPPARADDRG